MIELITVLVWPSIALITIFILKKPLTNILNKISSAGEVSMSVGNLSVQAKAMREIHDSIGVGFSESMVDKQQVKALIDAKIRSIQSAMEYELNQTEVRTDPRIVKSELIKIKRENGEEFEGETLDISNAGIAFKSQGRIDFHEPVQIQPTNEPSQEENSFWKKLKIVRIEQSQEGFYYGARVPQL